MDYFDRFGPVDPVDPADPFLARKAIRSNLLKLSWHCYRWRVNGVSYDAMQTVSVFGSADTSARVLTVIIFVFSTAVAIGFSRIV